MDDHDDGCRMHEFARWSRIMLEHEREHLSRALATRSGFMDEGTRAGILHDIKDVDYLLSGLETRIGL